MTLLLVRHAQSRGNAAGTIQGWRDEPLTALGRRQASALARRLPARHPPVTALYSSTLARARETAAPLARALGAELTLEPDLREYGYGSAEGLRWAEVERRFGVTLGQWGRGALPGEEGPEAFRRRALGCVERLAARHQGDDAVAVAVTHGGVIGAVLARLLDVQDGSSPRLHLPNCAVVALARGPEGDALLSLGDGRPLASLVGAAGARGGAGGV